MCAWCGIAGWERGAGRRRFVEDLAGPEPVPGADAFQRAWEAYRAAQDATGHVTPAAPGGQSTTAVPSISTSRSGSASD